MKKLFPIVLSLCLSGISALAQGAYTPQEREVMESRSLWTATDNAAAFSFSPLPHFGLVGVKGSRQEGEFRPAREASGSTSITAMAAGDATVGKLFLLGDFAFRNIFDNGCNYNTNQYEPTDDMPYYILDTNPSRWIRQEYDMRVRASLPLSSVLAAGLDVHYIDKVGAKQKDPRSETYVMDIDIRPSLAWKPAQAHLFGVSFLFLYDYERAYPSNNNYRIDQKTVCTLGLGEVNNSYVGGNNGLKEYYYTRYLYGGALHYAYEGDFALRAELRGLMGSTEVEHKKALPESKGRTETLRIDASALLLWGEKANRLEVKALYRATDGIEKVQRLDDTAFNQQWITIATNHMSDYDRMEASLEYDHIFGLNGLSYVWSTGGRVHFANEFDAYLLPASSFNWTRLGAEAFASRRFSVRKSSLYARAGIGYDKSLNGEYVYGGVKTDSPAIGLYQEDIAFYSADCAQVRASATWSLTHRKTCFNLGLEGGFKKALSGEGSRFSAALSFDIFF